MLFSVHHGYNVYFLATACMNDGECWHFYIYYHFGCCFLGNIETYYNKSSHCIGSFYSVQLSGHAIPLKGFRKLCLDPVNVYRLLLLAETLKIACIFLKKLWREFSHIFSCFVASVSYTQTQKIVTSPCCHSPNRCMTTAT